ncbi:MAG TPA: hypothetical protein VGK73_37920, partial [Polyangiaceae bacterium]
LWQGRVAAGAPGYPDCEANKAAWYPPDTKHNRYVDYMDSNSVDSAATHRLILNDLLDNYARLFGVAPTSSSSAWPAGCSDDAGVSARIAALKQPAAALAEMQRFLLELDRFEATRTVADEALRRNYRLCQAMWSSTADAHKARIPETDQWFVVFPESEPTKQ